MKAASLIMHRAGQAGEQEHRGLSTPRGPSGTGHAHSPKESWALHRDTPCFSFWWVCLGFSRVPASLLRSRQGLPSPFGQKPSSCSSEPSGLPGHEPVDFTEARLPILRATARQIGRPPHSLLYRAIPLSSWAVRLRSIGHPRPQLPHPPRGALKRFC